MKKTLLFVMALSFVGCHSRLLGNSKDAEQTAALTVPDVPAFQLPIILGYAPIESRGWMANGEMLLTPNRPYMATWIYNGREWIRYPIPSSNVVYDSQTGLLKFTGFSPSCYYVVYQWLPN